MSDKRRRFRAILKSLKEMYPQEPQGNLARHLITLAALISGIVQSDAFRLQGAPHDAAEAPAVAHAEAARD